MTGPRGVLAALLFAAAPAAGARTLVVNDAGADCSLPAGYTTIQAAVDAATAERATRVHVCPGTYGELVHVDGFRRLTLEADPGARIEPPGPLSNGAIVEVVDSRKVEVRGFEIDGAGRFSGAGIFVYGVLFRDSSGSIEGNTITGIRPEPFAASFAHAIHVVDTDPGDAVPVKIRIRGNLLEDYGQMAMDVADAVSVRIEDNVMLGRGPISELQLGAILRQAARGRVSGNVISGHWYTTFRAASGLVLENSSRVRVERNSFDANDEAVSIDGPVHRNRVANNDVTGARFGVSLEGLADEPAEGNEVTGNRIGAAPGMGVTGVEISNASRTRVSGNDATGFATFVDDLGTDTKLSKNTCDGVPCP